LGLYTPEIHVSLKSTFVEGVGREYNLPTPRYEENFAYLTQEQVDEWISAAEQESAPNQVYLIGHTFKDYKFQRFVEEDSHDASYDLTFG
jgi:hypothetical protein